MKIYYKALLIFMLGAFTFKAYSQNTKKGTSDTDTGNHVKIGLDFYNNSVYLGRADTISSPTIIPSIKYSFGPGFFISGELYYITNRKQNNLDGGSLEGGYSFSKDNGLEGGASVSKLFYTNNSTQVSSSISSIINAYIDYDLAGIITPSLSLNYNIAKSGFKSDILINPSLSHDFSVDGVFGDEDELTISPTAAMNAGTQNFYSGYISRRNTRSKRVNAVLTQDQLYYNDYLSNFKVLDYEFSVPVEYTTGKVTFIFNPTYSIPENGLPAPTTLAQKALINGLQLKPSVFYFQAGISVKF